MQLRRVRAWMPCVDAPNAACPYDIHITVAEDQMAVASGQLLKQVWTAQHRKRFHFSLPHATVAAHIAFAVGEPPLTATRQYSNILYWRPAYNADRLLQSMTP